MKTKNTFWKDSFYYLHENSGASDEKVQGIIIGTVAGLMSFGMTFEACMSMLKDYVQHHTELKDFRSLYNILPECWHEPYRNAK